VLSKGEFRVALGLAALAMMLVVASMVLTLLNRSSQEAVGARQQFIAQSVQLEGLNRELVKAVAQLSIKGDEQLKALLAAHGISVSVNAPETGRKP